MAEPHIQHPIPDTPPRSLAVPPLQTAEPDDWAHDNDDPFFYGWRERWKRRTDGTWVYERTPLTYEDVVHPQIADFMIHGDYHSQVTAYLISVLRVRMQHTGKAYVSDDMLIRWNMRGMRGHSPDVAVFMGAPYDVDRMSFDTRKEGMRPVLIIEVTSRSTRIADLSDKFEHYHRLAIPCYIIVDSYRRQATSERTTRLLGYEHTPEGYVEMEPHALGRLWLEAVQLWIGLDDIWVTLYEPDGTPIPDMYEIVEAHNEARARLAAETQARLAAEAWARLEAEARARDSLREHQLIIVWVDL
ncbi:MAG: Uma2 family endonuclease [Chloroflexaceae bacterium]|nr:Uma2 family endonuclease [Chloroflexaceae bacterium]